MSGYSRYLTEDVAIFLFHGVIERTRHSVRNYTRKHILRQRFVEILQELRSAGQAVSMPQIVDWALVGRPLPKGAFAVTFDDGFENNYSVAAPVLADLQVPATFYVTTGFIENNSLSWIDQVENAVEARQRFSLSWKEPKLNGVFETSAQKIALLSRVREHVKANALIDPYRFADEFCRHLGVTDLRPDPDLDQKMTWEQIRQLDREGFTIGGHGHTHRILEFLNTPELEREISQSLQLLVGKTGISARHYSYPEGLAHCYSNRVIDMLRRHQIVCSPSAEHGTNAAGADLFRLKRIMAE